jgi:predicted nucleic-acid-binding Zn-ribbon protein
MDLLNKQDNKIKYFVKDGVFDSESLQFDNNIKRIVLYNKERKESGVTITGKVMKENQEPYIVTGEFLIYPDREDGYSDLNLYNKSISLKYRPKSEEAVAFFEQIDQFGESQKERVKELAEVNSDFTYRKMRQTYLHKISGDTLSSVDLRFDTYTKDKNTNFNTTFYDIDMKEIKGIKSIESLKEVFKQYGERVLVNIQFSLDFSIVIDHDTPTYTYRIIPRIKLLKVREQTEQSDYSRKQNDSFVHIRDVIDDEFVKRVTLKPEEDKTRLERQSYMKFAIDGRIGQQIRLNDIVLTKKEGQSIALPPPPKEGEPDMDRTKIPLSIPLEDENKEAVEKLSELVKNMQKDVKDILVNNYGMAKTIKCEYSEIYNEEKSTMKLDIGLLPTNKTRFTIDGKLAEYATVDDLRDLVKPSWLGCTLKNVNIIVSKIWYSKLKPPTYSAKFRLVSCEIIPRKSGLDKQALAEFGKSGFDQSENVETD